MNKDPELEYPEVSLRGSDWMSRSFVSNMNISYTNICSLVSLGNFTPSHWTLERSWVSLQLQTVPEERLI